MSHPDEYLASLNIFCIKVRTPYPIGPVNSYLIKSAPYTLIDTGPNTDEARQTLTAGLAEVGVKPEQLERIILTHYHTDHSGLAGWLQGLSGAQVFVHRLEARKLAPGHDFYKERIPFLLETGLSQDELSQIITDVGDVPWPVLPAQGVNFVTGGEVLEYADRRLRLVHLPGHSSGHIGVHDEDNQIFFAGDFTHKNITPNPIMEAREPELLERLPVLSMYLNSLKTFAALPVRLTLPGHGRFIEDSREAVAVAERHHRERLEFYSAFINGQELTAWQLMRLAFPKVGGFEGLFLAISEVIAHLDYLLAKGRLNRRQEDGVFYYSLKE